MDRFTPPFERGVSTAADEARERAARDEPIAQAIASRLIWNLNSCENYGHGHLDGPLTEVLITAVFRDHVAALVGQACGKLGTAKAPTTPRPPLPKPPPPKRGFGARPASVWTPLDNVAQWRRPGRTWTPSPASPVLTSNWQDRNRAVDRSLGGVQAAGHRQETT